MALYIKLTTEQNTVERHLPFDKDFIKHILYAGIRNEIEFIQADGDELNFIISRFVNLPHSHSICRWDGELARFIGVNFPYIK